MRSKLLVLLLITIFFVGCQVKPKPIEYGVDNCYFCSMTIVDKTHGAEVVTVKGKIYKFDAIECMVNFRKDFNQDDIKMFLSNDYSNPGELIDATKASFLISKEIPSPMGEYLSAFSDKTKAENTRSEKGGELFNWNSLLNHFE